ncbi:MAG: twin-arginine translocase TatA/TatE family subunit [Archangium sp.]|nr:twin-arginine translocase TatA/TatE family subunit [Archangium sp.]
MGLKWTEILLILFALMLLFGASRLPQLGSSLGSAIRNFKKGFSGEVEEKADEKKLATGDGAQSVTSDDKAKQNS